MLKGRSTPSPAPEENASRQAPGDLDPLGSLRKRSAQSTERSLSEATDPRPFGSCRKHRRQSKADDRCLGEESRVGRIPPSVSMPPAQAASLGFIDSRSHWKAHHLACSESNQAPSVHVQASTLLGANSVDTRPSATTRDLSRSSPSSSLTVFRSSSFRSATSA